MSADKSLLYTQKSGYSGLFLCYFSLSLITGVGVIYRVERARVCEGVVSEREKNIIFFPMRIYVWKGWNVGYSLWSLLWDSVRIWEGL